MIAAFDLTSLCLPCRMQQLPVLLGHWTLIAKF
jgi:hypothetical protein